MARTKLTANKDDEMEISILDYIEQNASDALVEKINSGKKDMASCMTFILSEAFKLANGSRGRRINNARGLGATDAEVFGWAIHFFEEDSIKAEAPRPQYITNPKTGIRTKVEVKTVHQPEPKPVPKQEPKKPDFEETINLMDWLGGNTDDE